MLPKARRDRYGREKSYNKLTSELNLEGIEISVAIYLVNYNRY